MAATFATAVYVEAPPAAVFDAITDIDAWATWLPGVVSIQKLTPNPVGVGTEWRETRRVRGREATEQFRITRWEPPTRLDILVDGSLGTSGRGEYRFTYELVPERSGSNVELSGDIRMSGLWSLFARAMVGSFKKACHKDLEALKGFVERDVARRA